MRWRVSLIASLLFVSCAASALWQRVHADSTPTAPKADAEETASLEGDDDRRKPLPTYYGMLGISDEQRAELQVIQESYEERLQKLREELKLLINERDQKMEVLLTAGQKLRLEELRAAAKAKAQQKPVEPKVEKK
ncbi:hypothetical protein SH661x_000655 [Planctomicrobium sp. SH661]|uniref:hypothetical protein n=1 Tax=Planctomicrobium sp. SH661 TaxID=3448124 RepID=UPI003F5B0A59